VVVYHAKGESENIQLLTSEYSDQISEFIVDHLLDKYELKKQEPEKSSEPKTKEPSNPKKNDDAKDDVESEGKYELHISNISLKANENELRKLFEEYGSIYRVKLLKRGTM
jgi:RNA recognition motif-containing protein